VEAKINQNEYLISSAFNRKHYFNLGHMKQNPKRITNKNKTYTYPATIFLTIFFLYEAKDKTPC